MENTVAKKLDSLDKLQALDSKIDHIKKFRGQLPEEVRDLEDDIIGYKTRLDKRNQDKKDMKESISLNKTAIKDAKKLIKKYEEQQMDVRNNREYDAITKETELQQLEIKIIEKRIKGAREKIEETEKEIEEIKNVLDEKDKNMKDKKGELDVLVKESEDDEQKIEKSRIKAVKSVDEKLLKSYDRIRNNTRNGLVVVSVKRGACGGCFNIVPPQKQAEIRERKKIIVCEHCGRILSNVLQEIVEKTEKPKRKTSKSKEKQAKS